MNELFTIVIPYYAQAYTLEFLTRQLNYYHSNPIPMFVILAVSGDENVKIELEQFVKKLNDSRFSILYTAESDIKNVNALFKKVFDALKMVKTPYVILNGADDVIFLEAACKGVEILARHLNIAAIKGYTVCFNCESGVTLTFKDFEILEDDPVDRLVTALKDRDSIFYIIRRTQDLVKEYQNIIHLSKRSRIVGNSFYHIEHFQALGVAALGKVCVFKSPWRLYNVHKNNSTSHTDSAFIRVKFGALDKANYEWFKSVNQNMQGLSYSYYKFLWECHQIRGISVTLKQIIYNFLYKKSGFLNTIRITTYFMLHKVYLALKKCSTNKSQLLDNKEHFFNTEHYNVLKKHYFSDKDKQLLQSQEN